MKFSDLAQSTVAPSGLLGDQLTVSDGTDFPSGDFWIAVTAPDSTPSRRQTALHYVTSRSGAVFTLDGAKPGTAALPIAAGDSVRHVVPAVWYQAADDVISRLSVVDGALVYTSPGGASTMIAPA